LDLQAMDVEKTLTIVDDIVGELFVAPALHHLSK
jgi:hypothetical protein